MTASTERPVVWRLVDGKPGHEKQTAGLLQGLEALREVESFDFDMRFKALFWRQVRRHALGERVSPAADVPAPDLFVGAGHRTHLPMLLARKAVGRGKCVALMKPSLPTRLFDLVFVPRHDRYQTAGNVVETAGVICPSAEGDKDPRAGLVLVGGESRHFKWDNHHVASAVLAIANAAPEVAWQVCDSRRTPAGLPAALESVRNLRYRPWRETSADYLERALATAANVWVTADSASMLYEALAAEARVGVIELPEQRPRQPNKHAAGVRALIAEGRVRSFGAGPRLPGAPALAMSQAENRRCARIVLERLLAAGL